MMLLKKTIVIQYVLIAVLIIGCLPLPVVAAGESVSATPMGNTGGLFVAMTNGSQLKEQIYAGTKGWYFNPSDKSISVNVPDSFLYANCHGTEMEIQISYYNNIDSMTGNNGMAFSLVYDSLGKIDNYESLIYVDDSQEWRTSTYILKDAYFANRQNGYDFRLEISPSVTASELSLVIGSIAVTKKAAVNPVYVDLSTDQTGNIFGNTDTKIIHATYHNISNQAQEFNILYKAINQYGKIIWSGSDTVSIAVGEKAAKDVVMKFTNYNLFDFVVEINSDEWSYTKTLPFSCVNSDPNGIRNKNFGFSTHCSYWPIDKVFELSKKANVGVLRDSFEWVNVERAKGTYGYPQCDYFFEKLAESKMDYICLLSYGNTLYTNTNKTIPITASELTGFANYCTYMANKCVEAGVHKYEVWNEPDQATFNPGNATPAQYAGFVNYASQAIRQADEEAVIAALTVCGVDDRDHQQFFKDALAAGIYNYMDVFGVHPALPYAPESRASVLQNKFISEFAKYGKNDIGIWATEYGYSRYWNTEREQAVYPVRAYIDLYARGILDIFSYYDLICDGTLETQQENVYGVVNYYNSKYNSIIPFGAHEAYVTIANLNYMLADATPTSIISASDNVNAYGFHSNKFGKDVAAMWSTGEREFVTLSLGTDSVQCYDVYGNSTVMGGDNGNFTFYLNDAPTYIVGDFASFQKSNITTSSDAVIPDGANMETVYESGSDSVTVYRSEEKDIYCLQTSNPLGGQIAYEFNPSIVFYDSDGSVTDPYVSDGVYSVISGEPIYGVVYNFAEEITSNADVNKKENNALTIKGIVNSTAPGVDVSVRVVNHGTQSTADGINNNLEYFDQCVSGSGGAYSFDIQFEGEDVYDAYIYASDTGETTLLQFSSGVEMVVDLSLYNGDIRIESISSIIDQNNLEIQCSFSKVEGAVDYILIYALYQENALKSVKFVPDTAFENDEGGIRTYDLNVADAGSYDTIKLSVWDSITGIKPLSNIKIIN